MLSDNDAPPNHDDTSSAAPSPIPPSSLPAVVEIPSIGENGELKSITIVAEDPITHKATVNVSSIASCSHHIIGSHGTGYGK
jgi:hypothetical protein